MIRCTPIVPVVAVEAGTAAARTVDGEEALLPLVVDVEAGAGAGARVDHERSRRRRRLPV